MADNQYQRLMGVNISVGENECERYQRAGKSVGHRMAAINKRTAGMAVGRSITRARWRSFWEGRQRLGDSVAWRRGTMVAGRRNGRKKGDGMVPGQFCYVPWTYSCPSTATRAAAAAAAKRWAPSDINGVRQFIMLALLFFYGWRSRMKSVTARHISCSKRITPRQTAKAEALLGRLRFSELVNVFHRTGRRLLW